jgi:AraC-like DNA-binding protein/uncharacterized protein YhhL (DUF1145 family)
VDFLIDISKVIHIATLCVSVLLGAIILNRRTFYRKANNYLLLLLAGTVLIHANAALILSGYHQADFYVQNLSNAFLLVFGPSFYFSIRFRSEIAPVLKRPLLHFMPFLTYTALILIGFVIPDPIPFLESISPFAFLIFIIQVPTYILVALRMVKGDKSQNFKGLKILLLSLLFSYVLQIGVVITENLIVELPNEATLNVSLLFSFGIIAFAFRCLNNDKVLFENPKYVQSKQSDSDAEAIVKQLSDLMINEQLFINANLKIDDVAIRLDMNSKALSQAINYSLEKNFTDFINGYRVKYVSELIKDRANDNYTLLAVAEQGGFKSGSVFNAAFKKHMGVLPSQYRKSVLNG